LTASAKKGGKTMNAQVMTLGTFHFHQEGIHYLDIQSDARQAQVQEVVRKISAYKPNKIAVEREPSAQDELNKRFQTYLGDCIIDVSKAHMSEGIFNNSGDVTEIVMLGFPIAKANGVVKLHAIDFMNEWLRDEVIHYAEQNAPALLSDIADKVDEYTQYLVQHLGKSILEIIAFQNSPEHIQKQHSDTFLILNQIGAFDNYIGSQFLLSWYERNMRIFANIQSICEDDDRLLVVIGAGHLATLNAMINDYYRMDFVSPLEYLL